MLRHLEIAPQPGFDVHDCRSGLKLLPINHNTAFEASDQPAVLGWRRLNRHLIAGFEHRPGPTGVGLIHRTLGFDDPVYCAPVLVLRIDFQEDVRIGPNECGYGSLYGDRLRGIVGSVSMMREGRVPDEPAALASKSVLSVGLIIVLSCRLYFYNLSNVE